MANETIGLENLANDYPGRFIIIGATKDTEGPINAVVVYGITGRSEGSWARKLKPYSGNRVKVDPLTPDTKVDAKQRELIYYTALQYDRFGIAVSNGKQTVDIYNSAIWNALSHLFFRKADPIIALKNGQKKWSYEPDEPNYTPRIGGFINPDGEAALSILKRAEDGSCIRQYFSVPLIRGTGKLISTYTGVNVNPLPSFVGEPMDVEISCFMQERIAEEVWHTLKPDYRVSVTCLVSNLLDLRNEKPFIINKHN